ncbi:hypothetical protein [Amycolatopsis magusensis]|uniref:hypothetical protein n=1 Tax=Amycolatopsis magusensis TaxID=882444 RepID=UPI003C2B8E3F
MDDRPVVPAPPECPPDWCDVWRVYPLPREAPVPHGPVEDVLAEIARGAATSFLPAAHAWPPA